MDIRTPIPTCYGDVPAKFGDTWKNQIARLQARFGGAPGGAIVEVRMPVEYPTDVPIVYVRKDTIIGVLNLMKTESGFDYGFLADITASDEDPSAEAPAPRFEVIYNLYSMSTKARIRVKVRLADGEEIPTAVPIWPGANWVEREIWDMFGIRFTGHPNLRRILMDERWEGFPLRKDYPLRGYQVFTEAETINQELLE